MSVIVDSSVWVEFLNGRSMPAVEQALADGVVVLPPIVVAELISGALRPEERAAVGELLQDLPVHQTPLTHWIRVGQLHRQMRERGVWVSVPDAHVAQCALDLGAVLFTRDAIFSRLVKETGLQVRTD